MDIKIGDIVKYKDPGIHNGIFGVITEVLKAEYSIYPETKGTALYKVTPLDQSMSDDIIPKRYVIEAYKKYYEEAKEKRSEE